jgi:hypothetical protein
MESNSVMLAYWLGVALTALCYHLLIILPMRAELNQSGLISRIILNRRARAWKINYYRGYEFAENKLIFDIHARIKLEYQIQASKDFNTYTSYDDGIRDALLNHETNEQ